MKVNYKQRLLKYDCINKILIVKSVLIAGGSGMVGKRLKKMLELNGYQVFSLTRQQDLAAQDVSYLYWNIEEGFIDPLALSCDHVINLSGAGIADQKWTPQRKELLIKSRTESTKFLIDQLSKRPVKLQNFISASAIGYYGNTGDKVCDEGCPPITNDFLSIICQKWEAAAKPALSITENFTILRISTVLSRNGGALSKMDKTIPFGIANYLGNGRQYLSWIHIDDLCRMFIHCLETPQKDSLYNAVAPEVLTNFHFTKVLRDVINPYAFLLPAPQKALRLLLGEMADVVLNSSRIYSQRIRNNGFSFDYAELRPALNQLYPKK